MPIDVHKLNTKWFPQQRDLSKEDYILICGDFGGVWAKDDPTDEYWLKWLGKKSFTTLFVDGNHENFDLLDVLPVRRWMGGNVHDVRPGIIHLMRGQVFEIDGCRLFTMGGGCSSDRMLRTESRSWWPQEMPSIEEYEEALLHLEEVNWQVDYIITHTAPTSIIRQFDRSADEWKLNDFLEVIKGKVKYRHWYFGHVHEDKEVDGRHTALYQKVVALEK